MESGLPSGEEERITWTSAPKVDRLPSRGEGPEVSASGVEDISGLPSGGEVHLEISASGVEDISGLPSGGEVHGLSCFGVPGEIYLDQGLNPCSLHWQVDS